MPGWREIGYGYTRTVPGLLYLTAVLLLAVGVPWGVWRLIRRAVALQL